MEYSWILIVAMIGLALCVYCDRLMLAWKQAAVS